MAEVKESNDDSKRQRIDQPHWLERGLPEAFPWSQATVDTYAASRRPRKAEDAASEAESDFHGPFAAIRATLDYAYHRNPVPARQRVQDGIIGGMLATTAPRFASLEGSPNALRCATSTGRRPFIVFTAGGMGVGKGYVLRWTHRKEYFDVKRYAHVDPDAIKFRLPEMAHMVRLDHASAGSLTHRESGMMAELAQEQALCEGKNIIIDGSLRDWKWYVVLCCAVAVLLLCLRCACAVLALCLRCACAVLDMVRRVVLCCCCAALCCCAVLIL